VATGRNAAALPGEISVEMYARRVYRRWYVVVLAIVAAVGLVLLRGLGEGSQSEANATVYLGQPLVNNTPVTNAPAANTSAAVSYLTSPKALHDAARAAGLQPNALQGHVSAQPVGAATPRNPAGPYVDIAVVGPWSRSQALRAVDSLGRGLMERAGTFQSGKETVLDRRIRTQRAQLAQLQAQVTRAQRELAVISASDASPLQKTALSSNWVNLLASTTTQISNVSLQLSDDLVEREAAEAIEAPSYLASPEASRMDASTRRGALVVAAAIGAIVGIALALAWDAVRSRPAAQ
jgi:hypothetical protein